MKDLREEELYLYLKEEELYKNEELNLKDYYNNLYFLEEERAKTKEYDEIPF